MEKSCLLGQHAGKDLAVSTTLRTLLLHHEPMVNRYAEKLPKTINNVVFTWLGHFEQADDIYEMRHGWLMLVLLRGVRNANANLNKASVGLFESVYSHKKTKLLVKRLSCRSEILFYELITGTTMDDFSTYLNLLHCSTLSVLNPIIVAKGCQELVSELYGYVDAFRIN